MSIALELRGIGKQYRIGQAGPTYGSLRETIMRSVRAPFAAHGGAPSTDPRFWALSDVSLDVASGEVLGLIGRNGAGKSTLLRILARVTEPTTGTALLRGRVGSLLDVGTGFHPELTGRENIFLNGAILGMPRVEVRRKLDRIVEFAGVEAFLDTPVKHYSSGMRVRLSFAVAAQLETEILLADEVLAVGDAEFQRKCILEMGSLARHGRTVVLVSHDLAVIGELCSRVALLEKGHLVGFGAPQEMIRRYLAGLSQAGPVVALSPPEEDRGIVLRQVGVADQAGLPAAHLDWSRPFTVTVDFTVSRALPSVSIAVTFVNRLGVKALFSWITFQRSFGPGSYRASGTIPGDLLVPGGYGLQLLAEDYGIEQLHVPRQAGGFEIVKHSGEFGYDPAEYGNVFSKIDWDIRSEAP